MLVMLLDGVTFAIELVVVSSPAEGAEGINGDERRDAHVEREFVHLHLKH